ncbi:hypothetical protein SAMN05421686_10725 [Thalassolituus maritimus]|uniref:Uncharacterized protein n=1 Tax=Thalassolituus maritimus TaxID=484498 RepID=A0A1N7NHG9_9GAMM|nr:hypothetical protein [Thalassolituus maritimus]SIS97863.1 hypothetical protein SAMN05421686_10725 [Thalassolituus maritimus]
MSRAAYIPDVFDSGAFLFPQPEYHGVELISNGDFSNGLNGWTLSGSPAVVGSVLQGGQMYGTDRISQIIAVTALSKLELEVRATKGGSVGWVVVDLFLRNAAGSVVENVILGYPSTAAGFITFDRGGWQLGKAAFNVPSDVVEAEVRLSVNGKGDAIDYVSLREMG